MDRGLPVYPTTSHTEKVLSALVIGHFPPDVSKLHLSEAVAVQSRIDRSTSTCTAAALQTYPSVSSPTCLPADVVTGSVSGASLFGQTILT